MAFQWNAWDNEAKCEQFSDANYGGSGGGSSSSESNSAFSSLYHFPSKPMIHPACRRREKCSLLAFSLGLRTFLTSLVPLGSLPDSLELGVFEWELLPVSDESFEVDFATDAVVLVTGGLKVCLHWKKDCFGFPRPGFVKMLDSDLFISPALTSLRLSVIYFRDWKKGTLFGFVSFFVHPISCFDPCKARSVFSRVIFSNGACSSLKSVPSVSRYFKCSLFCRNSASSFSFSSLTLASDKKKKKRILP